MNPDRGSDLADERFRRRERLTRSAEYLRCYRLGHRRRSESATLHFHPNDRSNVRLGITASRKIGGSVMRHRVKRRVREIFRRWVDRDAVAGFDVVVHLQPCSAQTDFDALRDEVVRLFGEVAHHATSRTAKPSDRPDRGPGVRRRGKPARSSRS